MWRDRRNLGFDLLPTISTKVGEEPAEWSALKYGF
ncbi:hypothetical protein Mnod_6819 [Methylobacterium nodulans ORS 2060]|uniref:Uncharacterized protein n=1 Tax=Methylobacterium nodulans (strain LMG 21967 / CNCM I-2342 / ORS 2060) TaxID=460265 RepID=B8IG97_METNO|nr:hypothetical protein Mnod_6819 [Methylobacterium nodulans ORS 2060]